MRCTRGERRLTRRAGHCWIDMECRLGFWEGGTCFLQTSRKRVLGQRHSQRITRSKSLPQSSFYARTDQVYRGILNFCCPYTSQEEMATAIKTTIDACHTGQLSPSSVPALSKTHSLTRQSREITESTLSSNLYTSASPPLDILIRTSGVSRLSDFLLWQSNEEAVLHFIPPNWPDIGIMDVLPPLLSYQGEVWAERISTKLGLGRGETKSR